MLYKFFKFDIIDRELVFSEEVHLLQYSCTKLQDEKGELLWIITASPTLEEAFQDARKEILIDRGDYLKPYKGDVVFKMMPRA